MMFIHDNIKKVIDNLPQQSDDLIDVYIDYLVGSGNLLAQQSRGYQQLFLKYLTDKSTKTICEEVTIKLLGADHLGIKQGPDGFDPIKKRYIEVKPMYGDKLKGGNPFNDLRKPKVMEKMEWDVCTSGFSDNKLIFLFRFPFSYIAPWALDRIKQVAKNNKKKKKGESDTRCSPNFGYKQYINSPDLEIYYLHKDAQQYMSKPMYDAIIARL